MKKFMLMFAAACAAMVGARGAAIDETSFAYKAELTVAGYSGVSEVNDLPVLVRLAEGAPVGFSYATCDRDSLRFADASGNLIPHEIDTWNAEGESLVWVKIPSVSGADTKFKMYYGGIGALTARLPVGEVWSNYAAVWHLNEDGADGGTTDPVIVKNSSANGEKLDGEAYGGTTAAEGAIGGARHIYPGTSGKGGIWAPGGLPCTNFKGTMTISAWLLHDNTACSWDHIFYKRESSGGSGGLAIELNSGNTSADVRGGNSANFNTGNFSKLKTEWTYVTFAYAKTSCTVYENGKAKKTGTVGAVTDTKDRWSFGNCTKGYQGATGDSPWRGSMDEIRLSGVAQSADYAAAEYGAMTNGFLSCGEVTALSAKAWVDVIVGDGKVVFSGLIADTAENGPFTAKLGYVVHSGEIPGLTPVAEGIAAGENWTATANGLVNGTTYDYRLVVVDRSGTEILSKTGAAFPRPVISLLDAPVWVSGLQQARFNASFDKTSGTSASTIPVEVVPGSVMAEVSASDGNYGSVGYTNPYTGTTYHFYQKDTTFAYLGQIWLTAGDKVNFTKNIDDSGYVKIDEKEVLSDSTYTSYPVKTYTVEETGWHAIDLRVGDGSGGKGPSGGNVGKSIGLGYNINGITTVKSPDGWSPIRDAGNDALFLRTAEPNGLSLMGMGTYDKSGEDAIVWLSFANVPVASELRAYYDIEDRGDSPKGWAGYVSVATIPAGDTLPLPYVARGVAVNGAIRMALVVPGSEARQGMYQFSPAISFGGQTTPSISVAEKDIRYTDGDVTVTLNSFGMGASSAAVSLELADNEEMENARTIDLGTWDMLKSEVVTVGELSTNSVYYFRAQATNQNGTGRSAVLPVMTLLPTAGAGDFVVTAIGSASQTFEATLLEMGDDSTSAVLTMELSTAEDFDEIASSASVEVDAVGTQSITVEGLESNVAYFSRLMVSNTWGFVTYSPVQSHSTFAPVECVGVGYATTETGFDVSVAISYVSVGDATVTLFADGVQVGEAQPITVAGNYPFAVTTDAKSVALKAVVAYGATEKEFTITATKGNSNLIVGNVADHATVATMLKVKPGDQITLPPLAGLASYKVLNHSFLSLDGAVLTALKPGIVGVEAYGADAALVATIGIIVLPEKIGNGNIYIKKDKSENWGAASHWWNIDGTQATDYPHLADDIAIIPDSETWKCFMPIPAGAVLGGLYVGRFVNAEGGVVLRYNKLMFQRTDGKPVMIQACSNSRISGKSSATIQFADQATEFYYASDTIFDGGWDGIDATMATARPVYNANGTHEIPAGVTLSWRNLDNTKIQQGQNMIDCPILIGEGTVWNRSAAGIKYGRDCSRFTGVYRDSSRGNSGTWVSAPTWLRHASVSNGSVEVYGYVNNSGGSPSISGTGVGFLGTGGDHPSVAPAPHEDSWFPKKGLTMVNSQYDMAQIENANWKGAPEKKLTDNFRVGQGFSAVIPLNDLRSVAGGHPLDWFETANITHLNKGTLRFDDLDSKHENNPDSPLHGVTILHGYNKYAVGGGTDDPKTGPSYPIVPWLVGQSKRSNDSINFVCVDENERVCGVSFNNTGVEPKTVTDPNQNVYAWSKSLALNESKTFNSLMLCSNGNSTKMGADKTLTLTSGGLILYYGGSKHSSIGTQTGGADNGALVLGDETHPGYVFACSTSATSPCGIWAPTTAKGGLVFGYTGYALLAGDQTGVDDELVVNAGTLDLGSQDKTVACTLDVPVRILANATVKLNNVAMRDSAVYFDDIAGYSGKIQLNAAETTCLKLYRRDTPEETEWTSLPRGTYSAETHPDLFTGTGTLVVRKDDLARGMCLIVK